MTHVLIVDDVPAMAEQYAYDLKRVGRYQASVAPGGEAALDLLARELDQQAAEEVLHFRSAELSDASIRILVRKLEQLARDFAELATLDVGLPAREKKNVAMLAAFRPWVFSMFQGLRSRTAR